MYVCIVCVSMCMLLLWYVHDCDYDNDTGVDSDVADKDDDTNSTFTKCCTKDNQLTLPHALYGHVLQYTLNN